MSTAIKSLHGRITERCEQLQTYFDKKTADGRYDWSAEDRDAVKAINAELEDLRPQFDQARADAQLEEANTKALAELNHLHDGLPFAGTAGRDGSAAAVKSLGQLFVESAAYKAWDPDSSDFRIRVKSEKFNVDAAIKTLMAETGTGYAPANNRTNVVILSAQRRPVVADLIPSDPTDLQTIKYMRESTYTNNSATRAEGTALPENADGYTQISQPVELIGAFLPVTNQQLADVPGVRGLIDGRLMLMLGQAEEIQLLTGNGTPPNLAGFIGLAGLNTKALGALARPDAFLDAMTQIRFNTGSSAGFAEPSGIVIHPTDWYSLKTLKDGLGNYIWGSPADSGPSSIWGLPVIVTPAITAGTSLVGDFRGYSHISRRQGATVEAGIQNDDFIKYQQTLRITERLSLEIYRPGAFCTVTGQ